MSFLNNAINNLNPATPTAEVGIWIQKSEDVVFDVPVSFVFKFLAVQTAGDLEVIGIEGNTVSFKNIPTGFLLPVWGTEVLSAGTSAAGVIAYGGV